MTDLHSLRAALTRLDEARIRFQAVTEKDGLLDAHRAVQRAEREVESLSRALCESRLELTDAERDAWGRLQYRMPNGPNQRDVDTLLEVVERVFHPSAMAVPPLASPAPEPDLKAIRAHLADWRAAANQHDENAAATSNQLTYNRVVGMALTYRVCADAIERVIGSAPAGAGQTELHKHSCTDLDRHGRHLCECECGATRLGDHDWIGAEPREGEK
jgi:hypothetical protein